MKQLFLSVLLFFFIIGCSTKDDKDYNKPAIFWYNQIVDFIANGNLDKADDSFSSLHSEHIRSELIEPAILVLAVAHLKEGEHIIANFYMDLYRKKYGTNANKEFIDFLKLKSSYMGLGKENRQQKLLIDTIEEAEDFIYDYEKSIFKPFAVNIISNMRLGLYGLNINISQLYNRIDKPKASLLYKEKAEEMIGE